MAETGPALWVPKLSLAQLHCGQRVVWLLRVQQKMPAVKLETHLLAERVIPVAEVKQTDHAATFLQTVDFGHCGALKHTEAPPPPAM